MAFLCDMDIPYKSLCRMTESIPLNKFHLLAFELNKEGIWESVRHEQGNVKLAFLLKLMFEVTADELKNALQSLELFDAHSFLCEREDMHIVRQPYAVNLTDGQEQDGKVLIRSGDGDTLELKIEVAGLPKPTFRWYRGNDPLPVGTSSVLTIPWDSVIENEEHYFCRLQQFGFPRELLSEDIIVCRSSECPRILSSEPENGNLELKVGEILHIGLHVTAYPAPTFEWFHGNKLLPGQNTNMLHVENIDRAHSGIYSCTIRNESGETHSHPFKVKVQRRSTATEKKAFIIGNEQYDHYKALSAPKNDAYALQECLEKKYGFSCDVHCNKSGSLMKEKLKVFCEDIEEGAYVMFYFSGHGFKKYHQRYMMGVDAPDFECCSEANLLSERDVLEMILKAKPALLVSVLDCCLKLCEGDFLEQHLFTNSLPLQESSVIQCYATSDNGDAYEKASDVHSVYMSQLKAEFDGNPHKSILEVLTDVHNRVYGGKGDQQPQIKLSGPQHHASFSDPVERKNHAYPVIM